MVNSNSTLPERGRTMRWPKMRPRFVLEVSCRADHVMAALHAASVDADRVVETDVSGRHGVLTVPESEQAFWSTQLGLTVEDAHTGPEGAWQSTRVLGIFSPHPDDDVICMGKRLVDDSR